MGLPPPHPETLPQLPLGSLSSSLPFPFIFEAGAQRKLTDHLEMLCMAQCLSWHGRLHQDTLLQGITVLATPLHSFLWRTTASLLLPLYVHLSVGPLRVLQEGNEGAWSKCLL